MTTYLERHERPAFADMPARLLSGSALRQTRAIALAGRVGLVLVAVLGVYMAGRGAGAEDLAVGAGLTVAWLVAFRLGMLAAPEPLGPCVACAVGGFFGLVLTSAVAHWVPAAQLSAGRSLVMAAAVVASVAVWDCAVSHTTAARRRVLVVGTAEAADTVAHEAAEAECHFDVLGLVHDGDESPPHDVPDLGPLDDLGEVISALEPDLVVVADGSACAPAVDRLLDVSGQKVRVVGLTSFFETVFGRVPVTTLSGAWFMSLVHVRQHAYARWSKRTFDLVAACLALLLAAPVMAVIALVLAPTGSVLYRQTRLGEGGRRFTILKFRTMREDAEESGGPVWWAGEGDPRVTRVGRILRRAHLDELPQLFNVLRGEMSMVGPRPERPEFVELLEDRVPFWHRRLLVNPGVTGWAQLKGGYAADCQAMADKLSYDLWYLRNRNVVVDLAICMRTAAEMLSGLIPSRARRTTR